MDPAQKSFELQAQVRQNAEIVKNALNELYSWEKDIKDKEKIVQSQPDNNTERENMTLPIRSHIKELYTKAKSTNSKQSSPASTSNNGTNKYDSLLSPSNEKQDTPNNPLELKHKEANEIKDRGNKHVKLGEYNMAIDDYSKAIQLYAHDAIYYSNRALCYLKLERYDECIEDCERAIEIDRLAVKAYYRRMMANESLGNNIDALKDCTTVLMIEPKNIEAKRSMERINERLRKNVKSAQGPNFSPLHANLIDILPIDKPTYKRSSKPLSRIAIADIVGPKNGTNSENFTISDEDIDKLFNSNCGQYEEISVPKGEEIELENATNVLENHKENKDKKDEIYTKAKEKENFTLQEKEYASKMELEYNNEQQRPLPPAPTSTAQFYSNWKELSPKQKYQYLKSIPLKHLCKILGAGFDSDTLTDIIQTLHDFYLPENVVNTANTLLEVSRNKQVSILSLLMSKEDHKVLAGLINALKDAKGLDVTTAEQIAKNFNLN